jgi:peptide/nickel transport system substrate-binding protein
MDIESVAQNVMDGHAARTAALVTPHVVGFDSSIKPISYDVTMAKELLAEAGYPKGLDITFNSSGGRYAN